MGQRTCVIEGCQRDIVSRTLGYCMNHYGRWRHHGDPLGGGPPRDRPWEDRFWEKVDAEGDCWEWIGARKKNGYGTFGPPPGFTTRHVHRIAYESLVGPISPGMVVDHLCRVRHCVNPDHMEVVTQSENVLRGAGPRISRLKRHTKASCAQGHPFEGNSNIQPNGERKCRTCERRKMAAWRDRRRAAGLPYTYPKKSAGGGAE